MIHDLCGKSTVKMAKYTKILLILWLTITTGVSQEVKLECKESVTKTPAGKSPYWKYRGTRYTTSDDFLCWKKNWELFLRECNTTTGEWQPDHVECEDEAKLRRYCPEDLLEIRTNDDKEPLCLKMSVEPHAYNDTFCHGSNVIKPTDLPKHQRQSLLKFLQNQNIHEYWLPLRRENMSMPFQIRLPGKHWGETVDDDMDFMDFRSDNNCMSLGVQFRSESKSKLKFKSKTDKLKEDFNIRISDCNLSLHSICIFQDNLITYSGCPHGLGSLSYRPNECYGVNWDKPYSEDAQRVSIREYFRNRNALSRVLTINFPKEKRYDYFEVDRFLDATGDKFAILMNQNEMVKVVSGSHFQPIFYKEILNLNSNAVKLTMKMDVELQELILTVYNRKYLWRLDEDDSGVKCYTNSDYELIRTTKTDLFWENKSKTITRFRVKLLGEGPGEYWCEGHSIQNFQLISSPRIVATEQTKGHVYAIRLNTTCLIGNKNLCYNIHKNSKDIAKHVRYLLKMQCKNICHELVIHSVRIMRIDHFLGIHFESWIHLSASLKNSAVDNSEEESSEEDDSSEDVDRIRHDTSIRMRVWHLLQHLISLTNPHGINLIRSTEYCFPERVLSSLELGHWMQTVRGQAGILSRICLQRTGMPYVRQCEGDFIEGARWEELKEKVSCEWEQNTKFTKTLYSLENSKTIKASPETAVKEVKKILKENAKKFLPVDILFTANILHSTVKYLNKPPNGLTSTMDNVDLGLSLFKETTRDLMAIYNYMISVKESTIQMSASLNSTNKLLEAFEMAMNTLSAQAVDPRISMGKGGSDEIDVESEFDTIEYDDIGVTVKISPYLLYFILNPDIANVSGIVIRQKGDESECGPLKGSFANECYTFLQSDHELADLLDVPNLQFATYVPDELLSQLHLIPSSLNVTEQNQTIIVIKVYSNDKLFLPPLGHKNQSVYGRVVSISMPGHSSQLSKELPIVFRAWRNDSLSENDTSSNTSPCNYWNYENWANDGIEVVNLPEIPENITVCEVSHLTPFAYLVGFNFSVDEDIPHNTRVMHAEVLDIITIIGCTLSLLGIAGIFITAVKFQSWRQKPSSKVLLQLSVSVALQMIILCFINTQEYALYLIINQILPACVAIGAAMHYTVLVQFFWMIVIAYLQFKRYVQVFGRTRPTRFFIKSTLFCWGVPLIPVILVVLLAHDSFTKGAICYPSGYAFYFGIILPIVLIIVSNFIIFCLIIYNILATTNNPIIRHTEKTLLISQIRLSVFLFFLLGFTWCFGLLSIMKIGIIFSYLFCLTATLQGFVIFLYFIILDPVTRRMWGQYLYTLCSIDKAALQGIVSSSKETTQTS